MVLMAESHKRFAVSDARRLCRSLMDVINDVVLILDPGSSRIIDVNRCAAKIYGYTKKELVGKKLQLLTNEPTDFSHALHSRRAFERTDINKQGETLEFLVSFSLIDYWGRRAILSINRDISERKRIEAAIAASEKRARLLIQGISEIIALLDEDGTVRFISPQAQRTLGINPSEVKGSSVFDFLHPQDRERAAAEFAKTVSEPGEAVPSMVRLRSREGQWVPFEVIANNQLIDPDVKCIIFTARDLRFRLEAEQAVRRANADFDRQVEQRTMDLAKANAALRIENQERRYAQTQLEHSVSLLNSTLESTVDGILVISNGGRVSSCNQKFLDMWHIPRIAVAGLRNEDLLASVAPQLETPEDFLDDLETMQAKSDTVGFKMLTLKDGRIFERYSQPQRVDGAIVGRVWSFRDVTQARRLEDELRQAQKMEAVGRLAGGVAHEFNNVLMIISGYADQLLHDPELPESDRAYCERLIEDTRRATVLVRQLLAFSRKHPIRRQTVDINAIVKDISKMLQPLLSTRIQLVVVCPDTKLIVNADPSQLELMIMNLVINARDAMPNGGILSLMTSSETLREEVALPEAPKEFVVLQINDTGIGMPPEIKQRIFEPFFSTKDVGKGTGLGLSMVYGIVEQADGHITVESEPNHGTTFRIYLPLSHGQPTERPEEAKALPSKGTATLLLVEDEVGIRLMTRKYLESLGYKVLEADTGEQAWTVFNENKDAIQLLITDMIMPGMRGDELVRRIREERPYMPVIYISGYVDTFELDPETFFLEKPFSFPELGRRVEASLAGARHTGTLTESAAAEPPHNA
jgi:two-component system, cell cycle sensor histidine kinase and response regulator CckA